MCNEKIIRILELHHIPYYEKNGEVFADSMIAYTELFQEVENVTGWSKRQLYDWLGY